MKFQFKTSFAVSFLLTIMLLRHPSYAQTANVYDLKLLKAQITDTTDGKDVVAFFSVTTAKSKDFPPVLSMGITCKANDEPSARFDILHSGGKVKLVIYGPTIAESNPQAYALLKDQVDNLPQDGYQILAFYFKNLTRQPLAEMTLIYGLWEKRNQSRRVEQEFRFSFK